MWLKKYILIILYSLLLPLHIVNSLTILGGIKLFFIPVALLAVYNVLHIRTYLRDKILLYLFVIGLLAILPVIFFQSSIRSLFVYFAVLLSLIGLPYIEKKPVYLITVPLFIIANVFSYRYSDWIGFPYRYQGLYNDPNYMVISQIVGIYVSIKAIGAYKNIFVRIVAVISILVSLYIILLTQSRGGILALILFLLVYLPNFIMKHKRLAFLLLVVLIGGSYYSYKRFKAPIERVTVRFFGDNDSDVTAATSRMDQIRKAIHGIEAQPFFLLIGAGLSSSGGDDPVFEEEHRIHNTPMSVLYENGIFSLILFFIAYYKNTKNLFKRDMLSCAMILALFLQSLTIWTITYLPFWLGFILPMDNMDDY